jgi:large subunit ribosomal protein L6
MSRIGKAPVKLPAGVEISVSPENVVTVKGKLGTLTQEINPAIKINVADGIIELVRETEAKEHKAAHGLSRALINNMVIGVSQGWTKEQELVGVGYRANATGQLLELSLGYSHPIVFEMPKEITVVTTAEKGKNPEIKLTSFDKQLVGQVAAKIRSFRKPEPYKGKGIKFKGEVLRRKAGKSAGKK